MRCCCRRHHTLVPYELHCDQPPLSASLGRPGFYPVAAVRPGASIDPWAISDAACLSPPCWSQTLTSGRLYDMRTRMACAQSCTAVCRSVSSERVPAQGCAELQMSAEALRQGYKVGYGDLGIDESKELALTLTSRGGLWAGPKVDQLCQANCVPIAAAFNYIAGSHKTKAWHAAGCRLASGGPYILAPAFFKTLVLFCSSAPEPDRHLNPSQVIRGELRTAQRAHARKRKAALLYDAPLGPQQLAACPEGRGMPQLRATTEERKAQWMRVRTWRGDRLFCWMPVDEP